MELSGDLRSILDFLRRNGLSSSESALMDDILEKSQLGSSDFENFHFPTLLPPLKIPAASQPPVDDRRSEASSDEDFVSLASSTTDFCSSEFTNPYGIRTVRGASSHASSDRLSQFGTARDYHDFDMQNDLNWYKERDEDYAMPPCFDSSDPFGDPSEDKFITRLVKQKQKENHQVVFDPVFDTLEQTKYLDKAWPFSSAEYLKDGVEVSLKGIDLDDFYGINMGHKTNDCVSCLEENGTRCEYELVKDSKDTHESQNKRCEKDVDFDVNGDSGGEIQESCEHEAAKVEADDTIAVNDELLMHANEDEYEIFNLRIMHRKNRTGFEESKDLPIAVNSVIGSRYRVIEYLGSAAFSKVVQAHDLETGADVCLKIIKNDKDYFDQSLDEIKLLKFVNKYDPADERHILRLYDYIYFQEHLIIVSELLKANLYEFQKYNKESGVEPYFTLTRLQMITRQCLEALEYLHELGIIHCDLKPENIVIQSYSRCEIKVIDLGSSCFKNDNLSLYVQSRSYRAPEVILGLPYDQKIDLWSLGCILAELSSGDVLFPNDALVILLARVIGMLGPIDAEMLDKGQETDKYFTNELDLYHINEETNEMEYIIPQETSLEEHIQVCDRLFMDFLRKLLQINPEKRPTATEAFRHPWLSFPYRGRLVGGLI